MTKKIYSWALALCLALWGGNVYAVSPGPIGNSILQQKDLCTGIIHDNSGDPMKKSVKIYNIRLKKCVEDRRCF